jgi:MFS family permease
LLAHVVPAGLVTAGATIAAAGSVLAALAPHAWLALIGIALAGIGTSVCMPTLLSVAGALASPDRRGGATSTVVTLAYLGFLTGPALVGLIGGATTLPIALAVVAGVAAVLALLSPWALHGRRVPSAPAHSG